MGKEGEHVAGAPGTPDLPCTCRTGWLTLAVNLTGLRCLENGSSTLFSASVKVFPEMMDMWASKRSGETRPECEWHHPMNWMPRWNEKCKKGEGHIRA